ncbi:hypothetical protein AAHC03_04889 [Spirometra sp. Aus1]
MSHGKPTRSPSPNLPHTGIPGPYGPSHSCTFYNFISPSDRACLHSPPPPRLCSFSSESGLLTPSQVSFRPASLSLPARLCLCLLLRLGLTSAASRPQTQTTGGHRRETSDEHTTETETVTVDNLTLINLFLRRCGPMSEVRTTAHLLALQVPPLPLIPPS